jgi:heme oxygenase
MPHDSAPTGRDDDQMDRIPAPDEIRRIGLAKALREATAPHHRRAEKSGVISDVVRGRATLPGYALLLRNFHAVYSAIERGLERHKASPAVRLIALPEIYRAGAIGRDIATLYGSEEAAQAVPLLPEGEHYAEVVAEAAEGDGVGLIGHAYTRYLGDMSGGQTVSRVLADTLGLDADARNLYDFASVGALEPFKIRYREALDRAAFETERPDAILAAAMRAFDLNIALFWAVQKAVGGAPAPADDPSPVGSA